jgi:hypothetical protein
VSGKPGRSGPPGNLNTVKGSGAWRVFWRRRAVRPVDAWVPTFLEWYAEGLEHDKPGMTEGERRVSEIAATARGVTMLILAEAKRSGLIRKVDGSWDLAPGAVHLARFLNVERAALQNLGLDKRERAPIRLEDYLATLPATPAPVEAAPTPADVHHEAAADLAPEGLEDREAALVAPADMDAEPLAEDATEAESLEPEAPSAPRDRDLDLAERMAAARQSGVRLWGSGPRMPAAPPARGAEGPQFDRSPEE